jgi:mono/diheme cytochrome c family protein
MDSQAKYEAQEESNFFTDRSSMRMPVPGTVARGELREDDAYFRGKIGEEKLLSAIPIDVTMDALSRGKERYNIYCAPCHGLTGAGQGIVVKKGFLPPPSIHIDRLREAQDGHFFDVISNGIRNMPKYDHQIPVKDRWAIVAYLRALQRSQNAGLSDIPMEKRDQLK